MSVHNFDYRKLKGFTLNDSLVWQILATYSLNKLSLLRTTFNYVYLILCIQVVMRFVLVMVQEKVRMIPFLFFIIGVLFSYVFYPMSLHSI